MLVVEQMLPSPSDNILTGLESSENLCVMDLYPWGKTDGLNCCSLLSV